MFRRALTALAFAAALALPPGPARAQTNGATEPKKEAVSSASMRGIQYDLEIENGSLAGNVDQQLRGFGPQLEVIVKILRGKHPEANIAMSPELSDVRISDLKLHASSVGEELEALRIASGGKFTWKATQLSPDSMSPLFTLEPSERFLNERAQPGASQVEVFNFTAYFVRQRNSQPMDDAKFQAFKEQTIRSTREIVGKTVASLNMAGPLDFQFHEGANLLVVTGRPEAIGIARKVINAMIEPPGAPALMDHSLQVIGKGSTVSYLSDGSQLITWPEGASGQVRLNHVARLNPDGSVDTNFTQTNR